MTGKLTAKIMASRGFILNKNFIIMNSFRWVQLDTYHLAAEDGEEHDNARLQLTPICEATTRQMVIN
jgi:hypothetical protein